MTLPAAAPLIRDYIAKAEVPAATVISFAASDTGWAGFSVDVLIWVSFVDALLVSVRSWAVCPCGVVFCKVRSFAGGSGHAKGRAQNTGNADRCQRRMFGMTESWQFASVPAKARLAIRQRGERGVDLQGRR